MKHVVIYHGSCFDGVAAAWVVREMLEGAPALYHPAHYGQDPPREVDAANVLIVDFSYTRPVMEDIVRRAHHVTVIDHHKTAEAALGDLQGATVHFDMDKSGAGLAWDILMNPNPRPMAIDMIEDRDLWRFRYPLTRPFIAGLAATELTLDIFADAVAHTQNYVTKGRAIMEYISAFGKKACEHWNIHRIGGHDVPTINVPYMNSSDHVDYLMDVLPGHKFYAYYFERAGAQWQFGLRSRGDFDVSEIAKMYGGGGHKNASGFTVSHLPWETLVAVHTMPADGWPRNPPSNN